jgi:Xaa-Pro aminopeptidase
MNERVERARAALRARGLEQALLSSPHNVCYLGAAEVPIEVGPSPMAGGPSLALLDADGHVTLIVQDADVVAAQAQGDADTVIAYPAYSYQERYDQPANLWAALRRALQETGTTSGLLGVEPTTLPVLIARALDQEFPELHYADATAALAEARSVKTAAEIARLRRAIDLTAVGQNAARRFLQAGMTEIALFGQVRAAMEEAAGSRLPVVGDLVAGAERTAAVGGWPTGRQIAAGDLVLVDLAPRLAGYWGDSCNTLCAGEPTAEHRRMFQATTEALARAVEAARPGLRASELDALCRAEVARYGYAYPHHSGHALGTTVHEAPRLVLYEEMPLQAGMVLAVEPAAYVPGVGGVRSEHVILVTEGAAEVLSTFTHGFQ